MTLFSKSRIEAGLTVQDVADEFGVSGIIADAWERGAVDPPVRVLRSLDLIRSFASSSIAVRVVKARQTDHAASDETVDISKRRVDGGRMRRHHLEAMKPRDMAAGDPPSSLNTRGLSLLDTEEKGLAGDGRPRKPRMLDLFCCAGGAGVGYHRAGFEVVGVDIVDRPSYPFAFIQEDAMKLDPDFLAGFDAIHASPPCQSYSDLAKRNGNGHEWPRLIEPVRAMLIAAGLPYVIENVEGSPLLDPVVLCGTMFPGLRVLRHRLFEANFPIVAPPHRRHPKVHTFDKRKSHFGKTNEWVDFVQVTGGGNCSLAAARDAMGIDWMTKGEINEAIPPAYTELIGRQLMVHINAMRAEAERSVSIAYARV